MTTERILANGEAHDIEARKITLVCHGSGVDCEFPERMTINPNDSVYHAERVKKIHENTPHWLDVIFNSDVPPKSSLAYRHALGLVDLSLKYADMGVQFGWKYPETYLHPACQVHLADFAVYLSEVPPKPELLQRRNSGQ